VRVVQQLVEYFIEQWRDSVVQVLRVQGILLHLLELVILEEVAKEPIMRFFEASKIVLEHFIIRIQILNFTQGELGVKTWLDLV
jgi:hypothetical protein